MLFLIAGVWLAAASADCPTQPSSGASLPMAIDLNRRQSGPPSQVFLDVPMVPRVDCIGTPPAADVLRGEHDDLLNPRH